MVVRDPVVIKWCMDGSVVVVPDRNIACHIYAGGRGLSESFGHGG